MGLVDGSMELLPASVFMYISYSISYMSGWRVCTFIENWVEVYSVGSNEGAKGQSNINIKRHCYV